MKITLASIAAFSILLLAVFLAIKIFTFYWIIVVINLFLLFISNVFLFAYLEQKGHSYPKATSWPSLSVLIPNYNSSKTLAKCLAAVQSLDYAKQFEIIFIDDGSSDNSLKIARQFKGVKIIEKKKNTGKASALNIAIKKAKGDIIACIDSDTYPAQDALMHMVPYFADEKVASVSGLVRAYKPKNLIEYVQEIEYTIAFGFYQSALAFMNGILVTPGPMSLYRRKLLIKLGGYDEQNLTEDMEIAFRFQQHGYKILTCPDAHIFTEVPKSLNSWVKQRTRWYRGKFFNSWKYRHMILNPEYNNFGLFVLPFSIIAEMISISLLILVIMFNFENLSKWFSLFISWLNLGNLPIVALIPKDLIIMHSSLYFYFITLLVLGFLIFISAKIAKKQHKLSDAPSILFFLLCYGLMISSVYFISLFKELNKSRQKW